MVKKIIVTGVLSTAKTSKSSCYYFNVVKDANKKEIKEAVELIFPHVNVRKVRTISYRHDRPTRYKRMMKNGSPQRVMTAYSSVKKAEHTRPSLFLKGGLKKAAVQLAAGQTIKFKG